MLDPLTYKGYYGGIIDFGKFDSYRGLIGMTAILTWVSYNSTNLDYLQLLLGDILTYKIHLPCDVCNSL